MNTNANSAAAAPPPTRLVGKIVDRISGVEADAWDRLAGSQPFLRHTFLDLLESTGCCSAKSGWLPQHFTLWEASELVAAVPLYLKGHSYGEYVFDWAWADAYERHGVAYYPKLLSAIPFTPVAGTRLLARDAYCATSALASVLALAREQSLSSYHCLFPTESEATLMQEQGMLLRTGVQFHWHNCGYSSFDQFLAEFTHDKRKKIRQERRRVRDAGVHYRRTCGTDITESDWRFFFSCYSGTYRAHHSTPYLNLDFFLELGRRMSDNTLLVIAEMDGKPLAAALNLLDDQAVYGRYWGTRGYVSGLHFETCYYQGLEFAIERGLSRVEGGAQGEHKLARGFLPSQTYSAHWLKEPGFYHAVQRFLEREGAGIDAYVDELNEHSPFRKEGR